MQIEELKNVYKGKKILLTGHTGFKGVWMMAALNQLGAEIIGYALAPEADSLYHAIDGDNHCHSIIGDIRDKTYLDQIIQKLQPDYVFHLAAQALVLSSYEDPLYTFEVNTMGTANLLESLRKLENKCHAVIVTTDKVYRNMETERAYTEEDQLGGHDPYSGSKAAAELVADSYIRSFFSGAQSNIKVCTARAGNVIGGGDWSKHRIIPDTISALLDSKPVIVRNPSSIRPWQHVLEPVFGYLYLAARMGDRHLPSAFNFGPNPKETISVIQLVQRTIKIWGNGEIQTENNVDAMHESKQLLLNSDRTRKLLDWHPLLSQIDSIDWAIRWYEKVLVKRAPAAEILQNQIEAYFKLNQHK